MTNTHKHPRGTDNKPPSAQWDFIGNEFPLPDDAGSGCMLVASLAHGVTVYYSEYRVLRDCVLVTSASQQDLNNLLCTQILLSGALTFHTPSGDTQAQDADHSLIFRICESGAEIHLPGNQITRHVGVSAPLDSPLLMEEGIRALLRPFVMARSNLIIPVPLGKATRQWAADLFQHASAEPHPASQLHREGLARCYLSSLLDDYACSASDTIIEAGAPTAWELKTCEMVSEHILGNLEKSPNAEILSDMFGISRQRVNELFTTLHGLSISDYIRHQKLAEAKRLIEHESVPVKVASHAVGYRHVSNFTRAFRQHFGWTPGSGSRGATGETPD